MMCSRVRGWISYPPVLNVPSANLALPVFPESNAGDRHLEPETGLALLPGAYGDIIVKSRAVLLLQPGTYWFNSLQLEPDSFVATSGSNPTRIFVEGRVELKETIKHFSGRHDRILIYTLSQSEVFVESPLSGTLVAPNTTVTLSGNNTIHQGAVLAAGVRLRAGVTLEHHGFPWTWVPGGVPAIVKSRSSDEQDLSDNPVASTNAGAGGCSYVASPPSPWKLELVLLGAVAALVRRKRRSC